MLRALAVLTIPCPASMSGHSQLPASSATRVATSFSGFWRHLQIHGRHTNKHTYTQLQLKHGCGSVAPGLPSKKDYLLASHEFKERQ